MESITLVYDPTQPEDPQTASQFAQFARVFMAHLQANGLLNVPPAGVHNIAGGSAEPRPTTPDDEFTNETLRWLGENLRDDPLAPNGGSVPNSYIHSYVNYLNAHPEIRRNFVKAAARPRPPGALAPNLDEYFDTPNPINEILHGKSSKSTDQSPVMADSFFAAGEQAPTQRQTLGNAQAE